MIALDLSGFWYSSGAACSSGAVEPSHVLTAIGLSKREAKSCIRFSLGKLETREQVDTLIEAVGDVAAHGSEKFPRIRGPCLTHLWRWQ